MTLLRSRRCRCWGLLLAVLVLAVAVPARAEDGLTQPGYGTGVSQGPDGTYRPRVIVRQYRPGSPGTWRTVRRRFPRPAGTSRASPAPSCSSTTTAGRPTGTPGTWGNCPSTRPPTWRPTRTRGRTRVAGGRDCAAQTDCSITFRKSTVGRPAGATVRATITWEVTWEGSDGSGGPLDPPANPAAGVVQIPVQEIQTVVSP